MTEENITQEFRLKNVEEIKNLFIKEIDQKKLMSKRHKKNVFDFKLCWTLSYFSFCGNWIFSNFCFCFFVWYSYRNHKFCAGLKICSITTGIKKYKPIITKKKRSKTK